MKEEERLLRSSQAWRQFRLKLYIGARGGVLLPVMAGIFSHSSSLIIILCLLFSGVLLSSHWDQPVLRNLFCF
jgi:hypothetical protein